MIQFDEHVFQMGRFNHQLEFLPNLTKNNGYNAELTKWCLDLLRVILYNFIQMTPNSFKKQISNFLPVKLMGSGYMAKRYFTKLRSDQVVNFKSTFSDSFFALR